MAKEEKEEVVEEQQVKKKKPIMKIVVIALSLVVVVAVGVAGAVYFLGGYGGEKKVAPQPRPAIGALWPMEPFIVNLLDNQGERYLKVIMQLEVSDQLVIAELDLLKPKLRDNVLDLLSAKAYNDLIDLAGKQRLRDELATRLNSFLRKGKIVKVYFTDFVIQ